MVAPPRVLVTGHGSVLSGERHGLQPGSTLVVGRSRSCQLSLRRCRGFVNSDRQKELLASEGFRRVSRVHCEIAYLPDGRVEIVLRYIEGLDGNPRLDQARQQPLAHVADADKSNHVCHEVSPQF